MANTMRTGFSAEKGRSLPRESEMSEGEVKTMLVTHALQTEKKMLHNEILYENHSNVPSGRSDKQVFQVSREGRTGVMKSMLR